MNAHASPLGSIDGQPDSSLAALLTALAGHDEKPLAIDYAGRRIRPGYHVTEIKAGSFVTLDCGANADAWQETILQVEDLPARAGDSQMTAGKFRGILGQVDKKVRLNADARLTFEISVPGEAMQVFDVAGVAIDETTAVIRLEPRSAICKPRHRAQAAGSSACCSNSLQQLVEREERQRVLRVSARPGVLTLTALRPSLRGSALLS